MKLTTEQVAHVAKLARLALSDEELNRFGAQLSRVLDAVDLLNEVNGDLPLRSGGPGGGPARADIPRDELTTQEALANAPQKVGTSFAIPKVIE